MVTKAVRHKPLRDAEAMRARILDAVGRIVVRDGLGAMGINALARETGCDKVLIYRYFGDLDGAYEAFAAKGDFWWTVEELVNGIEPRSMSFADAGRLILKRMALAIRSRPVTLAVLAAEPNERTPLVVALESVREKRALDLLKWLDAHYEVPRDVDFAAITLIIASGITYIAVRARKIRVMNGVEIRTDRDWERLFGAIGTMADRLF